MATDRKVDRYSFVADSINLPTFGIRSSWPDQTLLPQFLVEVTNSFLGKLRSVSNVYLILSNALILLLFVLLLTKMMTCSRPQLFLD